jgi:hypothetical protein
MSNKDEVSSVVQTYFECMFESSEQKTRQAFHPDAHIVGYLGGELQNMSVDEFADFVAGQQPSAKEKGDVANLEIVSLDVNGDTAVARVRDDYLGMTFLDTLSFLKVDGNWAISHKLFHVEKILD